ncbi:MAG: pyridoxamine 5'-phosphate oxidase family protein [Bacteroides sp.]|nr:pyridoxamine 5'-phosphate oxidase family protein [Prevotella sp.]MCM1408135.1 pyridoxamine 5'-phosphate oxidase family protein [Treponema brennaborense]MCM1469459.1 pyridoxamine 5'-phosphate oxidase family protein [Bacteroides sp.]
MTKERVFEFIKKQKTAMISSVDENDFPNTKAMLAPRKIDGNDFYFSTNTSSMRVSQYNANEKACIYFYKRGWFSYTGVMLVGTMQVLIDQSIKDEIWRMGDTMFYKKGKTDPDYCVLKFTAQKCRVYKDLKTAWIEL